jgi:hypothetical protein
LWPACGACCGISGNQASLPRPRSTSSRLLSRLSRPRHALLLSTAACGRRVLGERRGENAELNRRRKDVWQTAMSEPHMGRQILS